MTPATARAATSGLSIILMMLLAGMILSRPTRDKEPSQPPTEPVALPLTVQMRSIHLPPPPIVVTSPPKPSLPTKPLSPQKKESAVPKKQPPVEKAPSAKDRHDGRVLLRKLEAGEGPTIEIAWPPSQQARAAMYNAFVRCYGMVTAVLDTNGQLYRDEGPVDTAWQPNTDQFSLFARQATGQMSRSERNTLDRIQSRHSIADGTPVRIFPRWVDALFLGGLNRLSMAKTMTGVEVQARYELSGRDISIKNITIANEQLDAEIRLPARCF